MEAWDVIVLGDGPAALHAAAEAAKSGASTLLMSSTDVASVFSRTSILADTIWPLAASRVASTSDILRADLSESPNL